MNPKIKNMYTELVGRLTLDKINVTFKTEYLDNYHEGTLIEDIMVNYSNLFLILNAPDFGITGIFKSINKFQELVFYPDIKGIKGSEMFLITGIPKGSDLSKFRISEKNKIIFQGYWEDSKIGYFYQVVDIN
jgi:hypothetical protein